MERNLERLTQQEEKYVAELDTALIQFTELKEQEKEVDYIALFEQRAVLLRTPGQNDTLTVGNPTP